MAEALSDLFSRCGAQLQEYAIFSDQEDLEFTNFLPLFNQHPQLKLRDDGSFGAQLAQRSFPSTASFTPGPYMGPMI